MTIEFGGAMLSRSVSMPTSLRCIAAGFRLRMIADVTYRSEDMAPTKTDVFDH
jgi:hypothetical protein